MTLQPDTATLGYDAALESINGCLGSNNAVLGCDSITVESVDDTLQTCSTIVPSADARNVQVSVIIPVYNAAEWLDECLQALSDQDFQGTFEISVFDDSSTDDVMLPQRVRLQYEAAVLNPNTIIGCQVKRIPEGSTQRYTRWINTLSPEQLLTQDGVTFQVYTSHGPTVVMPTWFCSRCWFQRVGPFDESGKVSLSFKLFSFGTLIWETIWNLRVNFLEERVLGRWGSFTIWNAGKQGRKLYRSLTFTNQRKVKAFCDVDENKIKKGVYTYEESKVKALLFAIMGTFGLQKALTMFILQERPKPQIPVLHYRDASPPFIVCVKLGKKLISSTQDWEYDTDEDDDDLRTAGGVCVRVRRCAVLQRPVQLERKRNSLLLIPEKKNGLTHEAHAQDVEQVYLRCSEGYLEWLYPTGAIIVNLRPNTSPEKGSETRLSACVKPRADSRGASVFVERAGSMRMLLSEEEQAARRVRCFRLDEGALFIQASTHTDISRRVTAFQYQLIREERAMETLSYTDPCTPCNREEILMAVCTSDFVVRGSIEAIMSSGDDEQQTSMLVTVSRLYRQKHRVFEGRGRSRWSGRITVPWNCSNRVESEMKLDEFLFTGAVRFGEAWLGCALQYHEFLLMYRFAVESGSNPCHMDIN
ncbi:Meteorin-like protein [Bagarius yarrelli]|uniref:Meteorin-like protein n=1 Tax=Bagarius yarrelli TaxID=175774 RepID=A0A556TL84_BAGYA|nr:Meteorin-like protein [Bagarius yarrelli]